MPAARAAVVVGMPRGLAAGAGLGLALLLLLAAHMMRTPARPPAAPQQRMILGPSAFRRAGNGSGVLDDTAVVIAPAPPGHGAPGGSGLTLLVSHFALRANDTQRFGAQVGGRSAHYEEIEGALRANLLVAALGQLFVLYEPQPGNGCAQVLH